MRNLSANALAKIANLHGNEPLAIVEIDWIEDNAPKMYADRDIGSIPGRIVALSDLDNVINVSDNDSSQELSITLDDTDGTIKAILDTNDIHKRSARVYQWFEGLDLDDRFLLFAGKISSPITWSERDRSVSFSIVSQLEDKEIGFSAEEGDFPWIPKNLIGQTWPMVFGKVQDVPCLQFNKAVTGTTMCGIGIIAGKDFHKAMSYGGNDQAMGVQLNQMNAQIGHLWSVKFAYDSAYSDGRYADYEVKAEQCLDQINSIMAQRYTLLYSRYKQQLCAETSRDETVDDPTSEGCNPVRILGGEDFPQGSGMTLNIKGGLFTGYFDGDQFHITDRLSEEGEDKAEKIYNKQEGMMCRPDPPHAEWDYQTNVPPGYGQSLYYDEPAGYARDLIRTHGWSTGTVDQEVKPSATQVAQHFWADAGSRVNIASDEPITYVVSIIPGTVLAVKAYKDFDNQRRLVNVPDDLWYVETKNYGPITAVQVVVNQPLSTITDQGWDDDLYVTFESDVGPHTCDILEYIIDNYTDLEYDSTSFTAIRSKLDPFPMNFPILDRKNTLRVLQEISYQARCALWLSNGTFYIKYLPEEPTSDATITESDIDGEGDIIVELTSTEDLVTKMVVEWRLSWAEDPNKLILRHNVKKYGTQEESYNFYCFNQPDIVLKAATFWLIRKSNTWKKVSFSTYLTMLNLETFDTATLDFNQTYVSSGAIKSIVEEANYNSESQKIDFICLTPIKSGEMVEYQFFWPSEVSIDEIFPTAEESAAGYAGGDGIGAGATGDLPIGFTDLDDWGSGVVWVGGPNIVFRGQADHGDETPSDIDFTAQEVIQTETYAELTVTSNPNPDLTLNYREPIDLPQMQEMPSGTFVIELHDTIIMDSASNGAEAKLDSFFSKINGDDELVVDADNAKFGNGEMPEGETFDFKYDSDGGKFGAGTAWLKS
jgi:hypothetical protein